MLNLLKKKCLFKNLLLSVTLFSFLWFEMLSCVKKTEEEKLTLQKPGKILSILLTTVSGVVERLK